jgi:hypothetical protein
MRRFDMRIISVIFQVEVITAGAGKLLSIDLHLIPPDYLLAVSPELKLKI